MVYLVLKKWYFEKLTKLQNRAFYTTIDKTETNFGKNQKNHQKHPIQSMTTHNNIEQLWHHELVM